MSFPEGAKAPVDSVRLHGPELPALHLASTVSSNPVAPAHITMTASQKTVVSDRSTNLCTVGEKPTVQNMRSERPVSPRAG